MTEISPEEWDALLRKYEENKQMFSVIIEGYSVNILRAHKKTAGQSGSRGKYISEAILYFEKHRESDSFIKSAMDLAFEWEMAYHDLRRLLESNNIPIPDDMLSYGK